MVFDEAYRSAPTVKFYHDELPVGIPMPRLEGRRPNFSDTAKL
jgi:hypothetical protein